MTTAMSYGAALTEICAATHDRADTLRDPLAVLTGVEDVLASVPGDHYAVVIVDTANGSATTFPATFHGKDGHEEALTISAAAESTPGVSAYIVPLAPADPSTVTL